MVALILAELISEILNKSDIQWSSAIWRISSFIVNLWINPIDLDFQETIELKWDLIHLRSKAS